MMKGDYEWKFLMELHWQWKTKNTRTQRFVCGINGCVSRSCKKKSVLPLRTEKYFSMQSCQNSLLKVYFSEVKI